MIWLCISKGDFSPLLPLSWKDFIYLQVFEKEYQKIQNEEKLVFNDIRFFMRRLSIVFTGDQGMNYLPSKIAEMSRNYERFYGDK